MGNAVRVGNAGEQLIMSELLYRGFTAGLTDRGNPYFDIVARKGDTYSSIRVKTSSSRTFQWTAKTPNDPLPGYRQDDASDVTALVAFGGGSPREAEVYLVPSRIVVATLNEIHRHYHRFSKRDGQPRKESAQRVIRLDGEDRRDNASFGFAHKWSSFKEAWSLVEHHSSTRPTPKKKPSFARIGPLCEEMLRDPTIPYDDYFTGFTSEFRDRKQPTLH